MCGGQRTAYREVRYQASNLSCWNWWQVPWPEGFASSWVRWEAALLTRPRPPSALVKDTSVFMWPPLSLKRNIFLFVKVLKQRFLICGSKHLLGGGGHISDVLHLWYLTLQSVAVAKLQLWSCNKRQFYGGAGGGHHNVRKIGKGSQHHGSWEPLPWRIWRLWLHLSHLFLFVCLFSKLKEPSYVNSSRWLPDALHCFCPIHFFFQKTTGGWGTPFWYNL